MKTGKKRVFLIVFITLLALILITAIGWFFFVKKPEPKNIYEKVGNQKLSSKITQNATLDNDNDGLRNWEEVLWKTDPNSQDTDKDGYLDKQETILGYDPADSKSNPQTGTKNQNLILNENKSTEETNLTQVFSKTIGSQVKDPSQITQASLSNPLSMIDKTSGQSILVFISKLNPQLPISEIKTINDNSFLAIQKYINDIEKAIPQNPHKEIAEDDLLAESITTENFEKIDDYIEYYETAINNMKKISVPSDFAEFHKREIELFMATQKVYESIKEVNSDPLKTVLALQENEKIRQEASRLITEFVNLKDNRVQ